MAEQLTYSINDVCETLKISRGTLYVLINTKKIRTFKIGDRRFVAHEDLIAFINQQREAA